MPVRALKHPQGNLTPAGQAVIDDLGLITDVDFCRLVGWALGSLSVMRSRPGATPPVVKVGKRVCFHRDAVAEWIEQKNNLTERASQAEADEVSDALDKHLLGRKKPKHAIAAE